MDTDALQRVLDAIDAVTVCGWCKATLDGTTHSHLFCSQDHQARWQAQSAGVAPTLNCLSTTCRCR